MLNAKVLSVANVYLLNKTAKKTSQSGAIERSRLVFVSALTVSSVAEGIEELKAFVSNTVWTCMVSLGEHHL